MSRAATRHRRTLAASAYEARLLAAGPVAYWRLDGTPAGYQDLTGRGHHGTAVGAPTTGLTWVGGGGSVALNGTSQYVQVPDSPALSVTGTGVLTFSMWLSPSTLTPPDRQGSTDDYAHIAGKGGLHHAEWLVRFYREHPAGQDRPNRLSGYIFSPDATPENPSNQGAGSYFQDVFPDPAATRVWVALTLVINTVATSVQYPNGYVKIYRDGVLRDTDSIADYPITPTDGPDPLRIGTVSLESYFAGAVGRCALFGRELSAQEISGLYQAAPPATAVPVGQFIVGSSAPPASGTSLSVDFRAETWPLDKWSIGSCISTYSGAGQANINNNPAWLAELAKLGPLAWRIPLRWAGGNPGSSAGGANTTGDAATYLANIRSMGGTPYIAIGGTGGDNNFSSSDVGNLVNHFNNTNVVGEKVERWILGNEPENAGPAATAAYIAALPGWAAAARAADPSVLLSGPAAAYWDTATIGQAVTAVPDLDIVSYHAYDGANLDTTGFPRTAHYGQHIPDLRAAYPGKRYALEEANWHSFYGPDPDFYTWRNLVWLASVIGHTVAAGGDAYHYSDSNGPLGLMNDGNAGQDQPGALLTKFPAYWAIAMWTGLGGTFRGYGTAMVSAVWTAQPTVATVPMVECYPSKNGKILFVNKDTNAYPITVGLGGVTAGTCKIWATNPAAPTSAPTQTGVGTITGGRLTLTVPASAVISVDLSNNS